MLPQDGSSERNGIRVGSGFSRNPVGNDSEGVANSATSISADFILADELNKLTFRERESINEEIHGVDVQNIEESCSAEEMTEIVNKSLHDLDTEIKELCSTKGDVGEMAYAFNRSQKLFGSASENMTYLNTNKIRIMFLRCERFDCKKAAERICNFADMLYDMYGDKGLERLICLSDLEDEEIAYMKQGWIQVFPGRDRAGRRVYSHFYVSEKWNSLTAKTRLRMIAYNIMALMLNDVTSQRRGVIVVLWMPLVDIKLDAKEYIKRGNVNSRASSSLPFRIGAIHCCFPSTNSYGLLVHMMSGSARKVKSRIRIHTGSPMECIYSLESFGINSKEIPLNMATFEMDLTNHNRWLQFCVAREKDKNLQNLIIECPKNSDILFGRGPIVMNHPGNIIFRNFIQSNLKVYSNARPNKETTQLTWAVVRMLKTEYGARFLKEERIDGSIMAWVEVSNDQARSKVRISFRDAITRFAKSKKRETTDTDTTKPNAASRTKTVLESFEDSSMSTSSFSNRDHRRLEVLSAQMTTFENISNSLSPLNSHVSEFNKNVSELNSNIRTLLNQQTSDSSTSTFLGLDASSNSKRQRLCSPEFFDCD